MSNASVSLKREALGPMGLAAFAAALLLSNACFNWQPAPAPAFRRPVQAPGLLKPKHMAVGAQVGFNDQGSASRSVSKSAGNIAVLDLLGLEGALQVRAGLPGAWELDGGLGVPDLILFGDLRKQLIGDPGADGPVLSLELGANSLPDLHAGGSLGWTLRGFTPYVSARAGNWNGKGEGVPYWEAEGGLGVEIGSSRLLARYSGRQAADGGAVLAQGPTVAWEYEFDSTRKARVARVRRKTAEIAQASEARLSEAEAGVVCAKAKPRDTKDPAAWESYGVCLRNVGDHDGAAEVFRYAAALRQRAGEAMDRRCAGAKPKDLRDPEAWEAYGQCLMEAGDTDGANEVFVHASQLRLAKE